jgi:hypothetical protein
MIHEPKIKCIKLSLYPANEPTSYAVGFAATCNSWNWYSDCTVSLAECKDKTDEEIRELGWNQLEDGFDTWVESVQTKSPLVGAVFVPAKQVARVAKKTNSLKK